MSGWDIEKTRNYVEILYGSDQLSLLNPSLRSVIDRKEYVRIHYHDTMAIFENFIEMKLQNASLLEIALSVDDYGHNDFQELILRIGAYVTACIQSLHAIPDILAHTIKNLSH